MDDIIDMEPLKDCWKNLGWRILEINGNCMEEICQLLWKWLRSSTAVPP